jgi:GLPGLI family protein
MNQQKINSMRKNILIVFLLLFTKITVGQLSSYTTVKIEFEKTVAFHAYLKDMSEDVYNQIKDRMPPTVIKYFDFVGDSSQSIYQKGRQITEDAIINSWLVGDEKIVYNDYSRKRTVSQKTVYEQIYLVEDNFLKIKWKITSDMRTIAGFDCRKAIGILDDTIAVFAFYTDDLLIKAFDGIAFVSATPEESTSTGSIYFFATHPRLLLL